jgi:hypothetical protein
MMDGWMKGHRDQTGDGAVMSQQQHARGRDGMLLLEGWMDESAAGRMDG